MTTEGPPTFGLAAPLGPSLGHPASSFLLLLLLLLDPHEEDALRWREKVRHRDPALARRSSVSRTFWSGCRVTELPRCCSFLRAGEVLIVP